MLHGRRRLRRTNQAYRSVVRHWQYDDEGFPHCFWAPHAEPCSTTTLEEQQAPANDDDVVGDDDLKPIVPRARARKAQAKAVKQKASRETSRARTCASGARMQQMPLCAYRVRAMQEPVVRPMQREQMLAHVLEQLQLQLQQQQDFLARQQQQLDALQAQIDVVVLRVQRIETRMFAQTGPSVAAGVAGAADPEENT